MAAVSAFLSSAAAREKSLSPYVADAIKSTGYSRARSRGTICGCVHSAVPVAYGSRNSIARLMLLQPVDAADQRRLARPRRTADHDLLAGGDGKIDVAQHVEVVAVPLVDLVEDDDRLGAGHGVRGEVRVRRMGGLPQPAAAQALPEAAEQALLILTAGVQVPLHRTYRVQRQELIV